VKRGGASGAAGQVPAWAMREGSGAALLDAQGAGCQRGGARFRPFKQHLCCALGAQNQINKHCRAAGGRAKWLGKPWGFGLALTWPKKGGRRDYFAQGGRGSGWGMCGGRVLLRGVTPEEMFLRFLDEGRFKNGLAP